MPTAHRRLLATLVIPPIAPIRWTSWRKCGTSQSDSPEPAPRGSRPISEFLTRPLRQTPRPDRPSRRFHEVLATRHTLGSQTLPSRRQGNTRGSSRETRMRSCRRFRPRHRIRGIAIAGPVPRPTRKQSHCACHDATTGVIEISPIRSRGPQRRESKSSRRGGSNGTISL